MESLFEEKDGNSKSLPYENSTEGVAPLAIICYILIGTIVVSSCPGPSE